MKWWGLEGLGISFALSYLVYTVMMVAVVWRLTGFRWSATAARITGPMVLVLGVTFAATRYLREIWSLCLGLALTTAAGIVSVLVLQKLLGLNLLERLRRQIRIGKFD